MITKIAYLSLLVQDQETALNWYVEKLGFEKRADAPFPDNPSARWLTISPKHQPELEVVLELPEWSMGEAATKAELIGKAPGWILFTDDCQRDYEILQAREVEFTSPPTAMPWGISAMFKDLYGYLHSLVQPNQG